MIQVTFSQCDNSKLISDLVQTDAKVIIISNRNSLLTNYKQMGWDTDPKRINHGPFLNVMT